MSENKNKQYEQKTFTVGDTEYTLQKLPLRQALELKQTWLDKNGLPIDLIMFEKALEHIVVSPKVSIDDFTDYSELQAVCVEALAFQFGGKYLKNN